MAKKVLLLVVLMVASMAESSTGMTFCNMDDDGLTACKPAVTKPDPVAPLEDCCKPLAAANLTCLCSYRSSPLLPAFGIDPDLALQLLPNCNLALPEDCEND